MSWIKLLDIKFLLMTLLVLSLIAVIGNQVKGFNPYVKKEKFSEFEDV